MLRRASSRPEATRPLALWGILAVGLVLRTAWALVVPVGSVSDANAYHVFARNIVEFGVYGWNAQEPGAYWPVGTSGIVAGLYRLFGSDPAVVVPFNIAVSTFFIWLIYLLGQRFGDRMTGLVAAALVAVWPSLIMFTTVIASEPFFMVLTVGGLLTFYAERAGFWPSRLLAGAVWAGASLVRPVGLLLPMVFALSAVLRGQWTAGRALAGTAAALAVMAVLITPWSLRNHAVFGERVLISTNFGTVFWMGNNPETTGHYMHTPPAVRGMSEVERSAYLQDEAMAYIREAPGAFVLRTVEKFLRLHERETIAVAWNQKGLAEWPGGWSQTPLKLLATGYWYLVLAAALAGVAALWRREGAWRTLTHPLVFGWMYFAWVHAIILTGDRYHFPAIPFLAVLAALGVRAVLGRRLAAAAG